MLWLAAPGIQYHGMDGMCGVTSYYRTFLRGDVKITQFLRKLGHNSDDEMDVKRLQAFSTIFGVVVQGRNEDALNSATSYLKRLGGELGEDYTLGSEEFLEALRDTPTTVFDTSVWSERSYFNLE